MNVAVITGASKGLGEEFARQLAARGEHLLLVARSEDLLQKLAEELQDRHRVQVHFLACDLAQPNGPELVLEYMESKGLHATWLVNNAGIGLVGVLDEQTLPEIRRMISLNITALTALTRLLVPQLRLGRDSRIINVASTAGFQAIPFFGIYAATKAYVLHFTEALAVELRGTEVTVTALCPGVTRTHFGDREGFNSQTFAQGQSPLKVVECGLQGSDRGRIVVLTQRRWQPILIRFVPRFVTRWVAGFVAKKTIMERS